ncbi:protein lifeguard 1-like [Oratosquilla oratoria]|uniref:protein lifeguard 1-like n=1 Tax=Oratosquilla oratoria TaxID=337810 RepID=UPI003F771817
MMSNDAEMGSYGAFEFSEKSVRMGFIKKVYGILCVQLVITFGIVCLFLYTPAIQKFAFSTPALFYSAIGITFFCIIVLSCCGEVRRKTPHNFIFLILFTICEGYLMGCAAATYESWQVLVAIGVTGLVTLGLTLFAFQTKYDFTMMGGMLFVALLVFMLFGIFALIFQTQVLSIVYACIGALLFSFFIVFDTQLMLGGKHKFAVSPEEYIFASLNLYLDIINLFMYILAIIGGRN